MNTITINGIDYKKLGYIWYEQQFGNGWLQVNTQLWAMLDTALKDHNK